MNGRSKASPLFELARASAIDSELCQRFMQLAAARWALRFTMLIMCSPIKKTTIYSGLMVIDKHLPINYQLIKFQQEHREPDGIDQFAYRCKSMRQRPQGARFYSPALPCPIASGATTGRLAASA